MGIKAMEAFGLTELGGPGVAFDCEAQDGLHINEDHYLAEVVDPADLRTPAPGRKRRAALYLAAAPGHAHDPLPHQGHHPPAAGNLLLRRTFLKMDKYFGRTDDMLIISGVNVFPSQIESLLLDIEEVEPQYVLVVRKKGYLDQLVVQVEAKREVYEAGKEKQLRDRRQDRGPHQGQHGHFGSRSTWWNPSLIARSEGKALRVVDERPKQTPLINFHFMC
jgi:phenylacetate-CoA ligase